jgi:hypothetical protein
MKRCNEQMNLLTRNLLRCWSVSISDGIVPFNLFMGHKNVNNVKLTVENHSNQNEAGWRTQIYLFSRKVMSSNLDIIPISDFNSPLNMLLPPWSDRRLGIV